VSVVGIGVNTTVSVTNYVYRIGANTYVSTAARTTGWHSLSYDYRSGSKAVLYVDGEKIAETTAETSFNRIGLGDFWADGKTGTVYYDDVFVQKRLPWDPETVDHPTPLAPPLQASQPGGIVIRDDFESGLGRWTVLYGATATSTTQKHGGASSYAVNRDQSAIRFDFAKTNKVVVAWFYDDTSKPSTQVMAYADAYSSALALVGIGVHSAASVTNYVYRIGTDESVSAVSRSTGWHSLAFDYRSGTGVTLYIDGTQIAASTAEAAASRITLGDLWDDGQTSGAYFDDVAVQDYLPWETPASPTGITFMDGFDNGFSAWTTQLGTPAASADRSHDGRNSFVLNQNQVAIQHNMGSSLRKVVSVWLYDDAANANSTAYAYVDNSSAAVGLGVNTSVSGAYYVSAIGATAAATSVKRSSGWHQLVFDYRSTGGVVLYIDGEQVGTTASVNAFNRIALGDYWSGTTSNVYFDDVSVKDGLPWDAAIAPFADGFDGGLAYWAAAAGHADTTTLRAHNGNFSYVLNEDADAVQHNMGYKVNKVAVVWMYDDADKDALHAEAQVDRGVTAIGLGVDTGVSGANYAYHIGGTTVASSVPRTTGWHSLAFDYTSGTGVTLYIDGKQVAASSSETAFSRIAFGDFWSDGVTGYIEFDDAAVQDTVPAPPGLPLFRESFESGLTNWIVQSGTPTLGTTQAHDGQKSFALDQDVVMIQHNMGISANKVAVVWFYDTANNSAVQSYAFVDNGSSLVALGAVSATSATHYIYRIGSTQSVSSVPRTPGWHSFVFDYRSGRDVTLYIDGRTVTTTTTSASFTRIGLGDYGLGVTSNGMYFDDVTVQDQLPVIHSFDDGFEAGFANWTAAYGTPSASSSQKHAGNNAYAVNEDVDAITRTVAGTNGAATFWFYDTAAPTLQAMAFADGASIVGLGVSTPVNAAKYVYRIGATTTATTLDRTAGWHSLTFDYRSGSGVTLSIDGHQVATSSAITAFTRLAMGDFWPDGSTANVFFDDVSIGQFTPWESDPAFVAPPHFTAADAMGFEADGAWRSEAYILEDNPNLVESDLWESRTTSLAALSAGVVETNEHVAEGALSGKWSNHPYYPTISTRSIEHDWSTYNTISFAVYSEVATGETIHLLAFSDNAATYWEEFYYFPFTIDFTGWKTFDIPFAAFTPYGDPAGWNDVSELAFATKALNKQPSPDTVVHLDAIHLRSETATTLDTLLAGLAAPSPQPVNYMTKYPAGFEAVSLEDYLLYVNNKVEYDTAASARQLEIRAENNAILAKYGIAGTDGDYALNQFVDAQPAIATTHDVMPFDPGALNHGFAELHAAPAGGTVEYQSYWKNERALYGYNPQFQVAPVSVDVYGNKYLKYSDSIIETYHAGADRWLYHDIEPVYRKYVTDTLGWYGYWHRDDGFYNDVKIRFDNDGDAYILSTLLEVKANGVTGDIVGVLLYSHDKMKTWTAYALPNPFSKFENIESNNADALNRPPVITLHDYWYHARQNKSGYLVIPQKQPDGTLVIPPRTKFCDSCLQTTVYHSGDANIAVTAGDKVYLAYSVNEIERSPAIPANHPANTMSWTYNGRTYESKNGSPAFVVSYDINTGQVSDPVFIGYAGSVPYDDHDWPAIEIDSTGRLHAFINGHHNPLTYTVTNSAYDISSWSVPELVGLANSYAAITMDADDTIHVVTRDSARGYRFDQSYFRKKAGQPWEGPVNLVKRFKPYYEVANQRMSIDPTTGKLFVSYYGQSRSVQIYKDEYDAYTYIWPDREKLMNPRNVAGPVGSYKTPRGSYGTMASIPATEMTILTSDDGGNTWHLATTPDFAP
ncbi:MAG: BNR-4 repeat-containing protein, partial [Paenibacillaceae bacterium]|nr:BNR-4 repeat-containing protein [Paenibacillaceae bacterium]